MMSDDISFWFAYVTNWTQIEMATGLFAASIVVMPKFIKFTRKSSIVTRVVTSLRALGPSPSKSQYMSRTKSGHQHQDRHAQITDREFHELVAVTNISDS